MAKLACVFFDKGERLLDGAARVVEGLLLKRGPDAARKVDVELVPVLEEHAVQLRAPVVDRLVGFCGGAASHGPEQSALEAISWPEPRAARSQTGALPGEVLQRSFRMVAPRA